MSGGGCEEARWVWKGPGRPAEREPEAFELPFSLSELGCWKWLLEAKERLRALGKPLNRLERMLSIGGMSVEERKSARWGARALVFILALFPFSLERHHRLSCSAWHFCLTCASLCVCR